MPLVGYKRELELHSEVIHCTAADEEENGFEFDYQVGTMIELPRAALTANEIAEASSPNYHLVPNHFRSSRRMGAGIQVGSSINSGAALDGGGSRSTPSDSAH